MDYEALQFINASGFQKSDDAHPAGAGRAGYRLVYKTLKLLPLPGAELKWPNLRVQFKLAKTNRGGVKVNGTLASRRPNMVVMPEYIDETKEGNKTKFTGRTNMKFEFQAWEEEIDDSGLVEILLLTESTVPQDILNEGRLHVTKLKTIIELAGGNRVLGLPIAEEVVEIFPDWRWNRNMSSTLVGTESELDMQRLNTEEFLQKIRSAIELTQSVGAEERRRVAVASTWYWKAESEADPINRFIEYWIGVEALEMPNTTNVRPVRERLAVITGKPADEWSVIVGKLFGLRSDLVHGKLRDVSKEHLEVLRYLLLTLFQGRLFPGIEDEVVTRFVALSQRVN